MMDRDGRLLETWGGRRGRNSSSCFYLLHTHTLVPHVLLAASRVFGVQALPATLTALLLHALTGTNSHTSQGSAWAQGSGMFTCWGLLAAPMKEFAFTAFQAWSTYTYTRADPLLRILLAFCSSTTEYILLNHSLPLASREKWSEKYQKLMSKGLSKMDLHEAWVQSPWSIAITGQFVKCCLLWIFFCCNNPCSLGCWSTWAVWKRKSDCGCALRR